MPLTNETFESLPYIDAEPTPAERAAALSLIEASLAPTDELHPAIPSQTVPTPSALMASEYARIAAKGALTGIDLSRYETSDEDSIPAIPLATLKDASASPTDAATNPLSAVATNTSYLQRRHAHLSLLDQFGKNVWLISNAQLEDVLRALETELAAAKKEIDLIAVARRDAQVGVAGELGMLEETWKKGVGRILETEVAAEGVRGEILRRRREMAAQ